jgi:hypothetical protein
LVPRRGEASGWGAPDAGPFTVDDALDAYLDWFGRHRKSLGATRSAVEAHIHPAFGEVEIAELTAATLRRWHDRMAEDPPRPLRLGILRRCPVPLRLASPRAHARRVYPCLAPLAYPDGLLGAATARRRIARGRIAGAFRSLGAARRLPSMDREYWQRALRGAGRELDAATARSGLNAAAEKLMRARGALKSLGEPAGRAARRRSSLCRC